MHAQGAGDVPRVESVSSRPIFKNWESRIFRSHRARLAFAGAVLTALPASAWAEPAPTYAVLLHRSLDQAPVLLEQAANVRAARGDARQAHAWPNPTAGVEVENLGAAQSNGGASQRQTTFSVTQPFEIGGKRSARIAAGEAGIAAAEARGQQVRVDYAAELAVAYATAEAMQQRLRLADEDLGRAGEDQRAADALVKAGKEANLRLAQAQAGLSAASAARETAAADLAEALADLSALAGASEAYTSVSPALIGEASKQAAIIGPALDRSPAVAAAQAERDAVAAQVRVERTRTIPDIGLSGGVRRFGGTDDTAFVAGISASIPLFDRNGGAIAAARERQIAADQRLAAARLRADAARRTALAQATAAEARLKAAGSGEAAAAEAYRLARIGYESGKTSLLDLLVMRRALSDAGALSIEARLARIRALAALARADGRIAFGDM
jgi:cobalt-zinc-cadmium efflux system outer membrane protein